MVGYAHVAPPYVLFEAQPSVHVLVCLTLLCLLAKASSRYMRHIRGDQITDNRNPATVGSGGGPGLLWLAAATIIYLTLYLIGGCTERRRDKRQWQKRNLKRQKFKVET